MRIRMLTIGLLSLLAPYLSGNGQTSYPNLRSEKILLKADGLPYQPGDTLSVSGSIFEATELRPMAYSKYVYVELIDSRDSVWCRQKWVCDSNRFEGRIPLFSGCSPGTWYVRAYTRLMCNFREQAFTILPFQIGGSVISDRRSDRIPARIRWYPEGGHLVSGHLQTMAFEVLDDEGEPVRTPAILRNAKQDTLSSSLRLSEQGLGEFSFIPEKNMKYFVEMDGVSFECPEPIDIPVLQLRQNRNKVYYKVLYPASDSFHNELVLFYRGKPCMSRMVRPDQPEGMIETSDLASGILAGVLLGENRGPVSERLLFFQGHNDSIISGLSLEERSFLLLSSDVSNPLREASQYLDPTCIQELNTLMLTTKWGRFAWEDALNPAFRYIYPPEEVLAIKGEVRTELGYLLKEGRVVAFNNENGFIYESPVERGRFLMGLDDYPDHTTFFLQAYDKKGKCYALSILLDNDTFPAVVNPVKPFYQKKDFVTEVSYAHQLIRGHQTEADGSLTYRIPEVTVAARILRKEPETKEFYGVNYLGEKEMGTYSYPDIIPYLERMIGFKLLRSGEKEMRYSLVTTRGNAVLRMSAGTNDDGSSRNPNEVVVLLDGFVVDTDWAIRTLDPASLLSIERLTPSQALRYTSLGFSGGVLIKTKGYDPDHFESKGVLYSPIGLNNLR